MTTSIPEDLRRLIGIATDRAGLGLTDAQLANDITADSWYTVLAREAYTLGRDHGQVRLIGVSDDDFDGDPAGYGLLDRITVGVTPPNNAGHRLVYTRCHGGCGEEQGGTVMMIARDLEGSQAALTLAELAHRALHHIAEEHDGEADWPVLALTDPAATIPPPA